MWLKNIFRPNKSKQEARPGVGRARHAVVTLSPKAMRILERLQLSGARQLSGLGVGERSSMRRKPASDFASHRVYVPGDDFRYIDWRASGRHENVFIKQGEQKQQVGVHLLLDTSASMAWGQPPKNEGQLTLAAALGYLALAHGDKLSLVPFGERAAKMPGSISGKSQILFMMQYLQSVQYGAGSELLPAARRVANRFTQGGILLILSDLIGTDDLGKTLDLFAPPRWKTHILHTLHAEEIKPGLHGAYQFVDSEDGQAKNVNVDQAALKAYADHFSRWQQAIELTCIENHAGYTQVPTGFSDIEIIGRLLVENVVVRV